MFLTLKHLSTGDEIQLFESKEYILGRKNCDISIDGDASISRKHAIIRVKKDHATLEDCKSKYHTKRNGTEIESSKEIVLHDNDEIQFGVMESKYRVETYKYVTTTTGISSNKKDELKKNLSQCRAKLVDKWLKFCTHLTAENIVVTLKFLQALIEEKPIVTPEYWSEYAKSIQNNCDPPDINKFNKPHVAEELLNKDYDLMPNPLRKTLFNNMVFVFAKEKAKVQMREVIKGCGGESISYEESPITMFEINNSTKEYLIVKTDDETNPALKALMTEYLKNYKRIIPMSEIALAIISCSCQTYCNPNFDRVKEVFGNRTQRCVTQGTPLGMETESECLNNVDDENKLNVIIPPSIGENLSLYSDIEDKLKENSKKRLIEADANQKLKKIKTGREDSVRAEGSFSNDQSLPSTSKTIFSKNSKEHPTKNELQHCKKRKPEEQEGESPKKRNLSLNPFNLIKPCGSKTSPANSKNPFEFSRSSKSLSLNKDETIKKNPFEKFSNLSVKETKISNINMQDHVEREKPEVSKPILLRKNSFSLRKKDSPMNISWLSKNSMVKMEAKQEDPELTKISEAFKDCFNISVLMPDYLQTSRSLSKNTTVNTTYGVRNFKKFKKVAPVKPQTEIIGKNQLIKIHPGHDGIDVNMEPPDSDDEHSKNIKVKPKVKKILL